MKRIWAMLLAVSMLAFLSGCGRDDTDPRQETKAEELHTFAGLKWDTPLSRCEATLEKGSGIAFEEEAGAWDDFPRFAAKPGYYQVLGLPLDTKNGRDSIRAYYEMSEAAEARGEASYDNDADWALSQVSCNHQVPLNCNVETGEIPPEEMALMQDVINKAIRKYGEPSLAYLIRMVPDYEYYSVPAEEYEYIVQDCFTYAGAKNWGHFWLIMTFNNVRINLQATLPSQYSSGMWGVGEYYMSLTYLPYAVIKETFIGSEEQEFPLLNGKPDYIEIDP